MLNKLALATIVAVSAVAGPAPDPVVPLLYAIHYDTGDLYVIDYHRGDGATLRATRIGNTGVVQATSLLFAPDGQLYTIDGYTLDVHRIDPASASSTLVGPLGFFMFEGGLTVSPTGVVYGVNGDFPPNVKLFTVDLATGSGSIVGATGVSDLNGLAWRSDGKLVGINRPFNMLVEIDPKSGATTVITQLGVTLGGGSGFVLLDGHLGFFATGGSTALTPGTHELWMVDAYTGQRRLVGRLPPELDGDGVTGLALVPASRVAR